LTPRSSAALLGAWITCPQDFMRLVEATDKDGGMAPLTKQVVKSDHGVRTAVEMLPTYYDDREQVRIDSELCMEHSPPAQREPGNTSRPR
jgi:hypothetical protein